MNSVATASHHPSTNLRSAYSLDNFPWLHDQKNQQQNKRLSPQRHVDKEEGGHANEQLMGSTDCLNRSGEYAHDYEGSSNDFTSPSLKSLKNVPPLPSMQRNAVGTDQHVQATAKRGDWSGGENENLTALLMYRDALKRNLTTPGAAIGLPKMRHGRIGSQWRHIKQTNTYSGSNLMFIDGTVRVEDSFKYPIPRYGYPPMRKQQQLYSSVNYDSSYSPINPAAKSLDAMGWSAIDAHTHRPYLSQHASRHQHPANNGSSYWPTDFSQQKQREFPMNGTNGYEPKLPAQERIKPGLD